MNRKASDIQTRLKQLCQDYARQLPNKVSEIEKAWQDLRAEQDSDKRQYLARLCHTLAGSGASYGFERITEQSRNLEQLLQQSGNLIATDPATVGKIEEAILHLKSLAEQAPDRPMEIHAHNKPG